MESKKENTKETITGAIIIYSCQKHKNTRLKEFRFPESNVYGWNVFIVLGNPDLEKEYEIEGNEITIRCEDGYIHLMKKVIMGMKIVLEKYNVLYGILRCGDDLIFNKSRLIVLLHDIVSQKKEYRYDYLGRINQQVEKKDICSKLDFFMVNYYYQHPEECPIEWTDIRKMHIIPQCTYISGVLNYFSVKACNILIQYMSKPSINWNVFYYNEKIGYPFIIEDVGIGFILQIENINPTSHMIYTDSIKDFSNELLGIVALHTNKYK